MVYCLENFCDYYNYILLPFKSTHKFELNEAHIVFFIGCILNPLYVLSGESPNKGLDPISNLVFSSLKMTAL